MNATTAPTRASVKALIQQKDDMETEMDDIFNELQTLGVGLQGHLVDKNGFPRSDIDVHDIRIKRNRLSCM